MSTGVSSSRFLWLYWGDSLWDLSLGSLDGRCTCPSCPRPSLAGHESFQWNCPGSSCLVWWVCNRPSHEWLVSKSLWLCLFFHTLMHWCRSANELCMLAQTSSALLLALVAALSKSLSISSILHRNPSKISSLSDLVVGWQCTECDCEWSSLLFHLLRWNALSQSLGGSWPDPCWAVLSGTAFPLLLSGGTTLYSNLTLLVLGDSCAPVSNPPPVGGGFVVVLQSTMPLVLSSRSCELMVMLVRFAPDCPSVLCAGLGHATFRLAITMLSLF